MSRPPRRRAGASGSATAPLQAPSQRYRFVAPRRARAVLAGVLLAAVVFTGFGAWMAATEVDSHPWIITTVATALAAVALWALLQSSLPQVVTIENSIIEITNRGRSERFDLADPTVEILGRDGEIAFRCYDGRFSVVRARDVNWKVFTDVVMHYQNHADRKAEERQERYSR